MTCPCRGCPDRYEACHDYCDRYKAWKAPIQAQYENRKIEMLHVLSRNEQYNSVATKAKKKHLKG